MQVEEIVPYKVKYSAVGIIIELLRKTYSVSLTKIILIDNYGI